MSSGFLWLLIGFALGAALVYAMDNFPRSFSKSDRDDEEGDEENYDDTEQGM